MDNFVKTWQIKRVVREMFQNGHFSVSWPDPAQYNVC